MTDRILSALSALTLGAVALALSTPASAEAYYCGNRIVDIGTRADQVLAWCGQPVMINSTFGEQSVTMGLGQSNGVLVGGTYIVGAGNGLGMSTTTRVAIEVQKWTYPGSSSTLPRFLWIQNGVVIDVKSGMY